MEDLLVIFIILAMGYLGLTFIYNSFKKNECFDIWFFISMVEWIWKL